MGVSKHFMGSVNILYCVDIKMDILEDILGHYELKWYEKVASNERR